MLHISIKGEPVFELFGVTVTNSLLTSWIVLILLSLGAWYYHHLVTTGKKNAYFYLAHMVFKGMYNFLKQVNGEKIRALFPLLGGLFFYIIFQNWFGLLPGVGSLLIEVEEHGEHHMVPLLRAASADLNFTLALGLFAVIAIQFFGVRYLGGSYFKKFLNFANPIAFLLGILEIFSEISRVVSFSFRLFGNIFAGEVLLVVIAFLIPVLVSFPFFIMEIFVGFVQALVFTMLTSVFIQMATAEHH